MFYNVHSSSFHVCSFLFLAFPPRPSPSLPLIFLSALFLSHHQYSHVPLFQTAFCVTCQVLDGGWNIADCSARAYDLEGMHVGTVAAGRIGLAVLKRLKPFGCKLHYCDRHRLDAEVERELGLTYHESVADMVTKVMLTYFSTSCNWWMCDSNQQLFAHGQRERDRGRGTGGGDVPRMPTS